MKYFLALTISVFAMQANAAFKIKPGLWEIETKTQMAGQGSQDMSAKMQEAMKKMNPAQRAQMEKMMGQHGVGFGDKGMKVCHSEKTSPETLIQEKNSNCSITDKEDLSDGIKFKFKCEKGSGAAEYRMTSDTTYTGWNEMETARGKNKIEFKGKFLSANCGNIKPLQDVSVPKTK